MSVQVLGSVLVLWAAVVRSPNIDHQGHIGADADADNLQLKCWLIPVHISSSNDYMM